MAAEDSNIAEFKKQEFDDTISCCICTNVYTDPKELPCNHTFCMKCLQETGLSTNKGPGDEMPCPICRRQFKIPQEGFRALPNNFFIAKLIQVANISDPSVSSTPLCDACLEENQKTGKDTPTVNMYCIECKQNLCEECCRQHNKFKLNKNHRLMPINEHDGDQNVMAPVAPSTCELHEQNVLNVYCADCKTVVCALCFIHDHKHHEGSHVSKFVEGFRKQIENNAEAINECSSQTKKRKDELIRVKEDMQQKAEKLESDVNNRRDELKQLVDTQANSLLKSLGSIRQSKFKEIQMEDSDIDSHLSCLESYSSYCQKMMAKGSDSDICREVSDLSVTAVELQHKCHSLIEEEIVPFKLCFSKSEFEKFLKDENLIGEIEEECNTRQKKASITERTTAEKLRQELDTKNMENRTLQANASKLEEELECEKATSKTLRVENSNLRRELDTERNAMKTFMKSKEQEIEVCEKAKTDCRTKILDLEKKLEQERNTWIAEKEQLISQIQEQQRSIDKLRSEYKLDPVLVQTIRTKAAKEKNKSIRGLTILDRDLFVVSEKSSEVEVYDSIKFSFSRRWNLKELIDPWDIGSCSRNKCLYIFNHKGMGQSKEILGVAPNGKLINKWSTGDDSGSLSVTDESNVILSVYGKIKLNEYSSDGKLIREINLSPDKGFHYLTLSHPGIRYPYHAIKLTSGHFLVSYGKNADDALQGVCVVDADGKLKKSFGGKRGSTIGQMNCPVCLAVDGNGFVMFADRRNSRVLLLDSDLDFKREILSREKHGLQLPERILLDQTNNRLFVADNEQDTEGRILIFEFR